MQEAPVSDCVRSAATTNSSSKFRTAVRAFRRTAAKRTGRSSDCRSCATGSNRSEVYSKSSRNRTAAQLYEPRSCGQRESAMRAIRIAVVDDHPVFREGVISVLRSEEGFDLVGEGRCSEDAVRLASEMRPDVMLLDVSMPGGGINALKAITDTSQAARIIVLTVSENGEDVLKA